MPSDSARLIVEVLEAEGNPLDRQTLLDRAGLEAAAFDDALEYLRGQQVVRYVSEQDQFRLTYWPEQRACALCGQEIDGEEHYELELRDNATNTESTLTGSLHTACATDLLDDLSLDR